MSSLSKEAIAESEDILNKTNIALARSRKLIQSWMSAPPAAADEDDEDDFKPESETAGIGSTAGDKEDNGVVSLARSRKAANDKLLEQLLGKKAAQAHRKTQAATATKTLPTAQQKNVKPQSAPKIEDDDGESRTSALKHSKARPKPAKTADEDESPAKTSSKRKANSYLDELLSKKARKKGRGAG